jgi:peroxin-6
MDELRQPWKLTGYPVVIVGTTCDPAKCSPGILAAFKHEIVFDVRYWAPVHVLIKASL